MPEESPPREPRTSEGCTSTVLPSRQAASPPDTFEVVESGRCGNTTDGRGCAGVSGVDGDNVNPETATKLNTDADSDEVIALRELVQHQREDLKMAALMGQRLLDSTEEVSAKLEVVSTDCCVVYTIVASLSTSYSVFSHS